VADGEGHGTGVDGLADPGHGAVIMADEEAAGIVIGGDGAGFEGSEGGLVVGERPGELDFLAVDWVRHALHRALVVEKTKGGCGTEEGPVLEG